MSARLPRPLLALATGSTFLVTTTGSSLAPYLRSVASDLGHDLSAVSGLIAVQALAWGFFSLVAGSLSDRIGRRPILIAALLVIGIARVAFALTHDYAVALAMQVVTGLGGGAFMATVFAVVSDRTPPELRGSALGWVMTGQSLSLVLGVPLITLLGDFGGWRVAVAAHGASLIAVAGVAAAALGADPPHDHHADHARVSLRQTLTAPMVLLLVAGTMERIGFATMAVYFALFLQTSYAISFSTLALATLVVALGNLLGNTIGGRLANHRDHRVPIFAGAIGIAALIAVPMLLWPVALWVSVALGALYSGINAVGRPAFMASLSDVPREVRGALLGFNVTMASLGWLVAGAVGGYLVTHAGFDAVGTMCAGSGLFGAACATAHQRLALRGRGAVVTSP